MQCTPAPAPRPQAVVKDMQRKVARREQGQMQLPVERFINAPWGDTFSGIGTGARPLLAPAACRRLRRGGFGGMHVLRS